ncbi:hypothetical protein [Streptomyces sporangiiformans]|uniref:Uncharacterized protein n=1 Tax=Streptomyces sporangiiformans TaxID=2315329 RepID=A0A505DMP1_9ACTN|nr:hypothetical protein [Streptomyces sporangiiformans]TPQ20781.1 hypothetical protein FGD71_018815 [Streptomyces sporangiiformans]
MKKAIAAAGVVLGGLGVILAAQGSAQAAAPAVESAPAVKASSGEPDKQPQWIVSAAKAAYVHGKAAVGTSAIRNQVGNVVRIASLGAAPADSTTATAPTVEEVFDK